VPRPAPAAARFAFFTPSVTVAVTILRVQRLLTVWALVLAVALAAVPAVASAVPKNGPVCRTAKEQKRHKRANGTPCRPVAKRTPGAATTPTPPVEPTPPSPAPAPAPLVVPPSIAVDSPTYAGGSVIGVSMSDVPASAAGTHYRLTMVTGTLDSACGFGYARVFGTTAPTAAWFGVVTAVPIDGVFHIDSPPTGSTTVALGLGVPAGDPVPVLETLGARKYNAGWCFGPGQATLSTVPDDAPPGDPGTAVASATFTVTS
jgi:type 1 fimbria pilin